MSQIKNIILLLIINIIAACKVGENDPLISIYSRDKRITGTWKLTNAEYEYYITNSQNSNSIIYKFKNDTLFLSDTQITYSLKITIKKDGTAKSIANTTEQTIKQTGYWYWTDNTKRKSAIKFSFRPIPLIGDFSYFIVYQLRNKQLTLTATTTKQLQTNTYYSFVSITASYTLRKVN